MLQELDIVGEVHLHGVHARSISTLNCTFKFVLPSTRPWRLLPEAEAQVCHEAS